MQGVRVEKDRVARSHLAIDLLEALFRLGDALAMVLLESRGLTRDDFAKYHPAGNLGRVLLLRVRDIMRTADRLPVALDTVSTQDAILAMTKAKSGSIALVHPRTRRLTGILTDGDFRRSALTGPDFLSRPVSAFMTRTPKTISADALGVDALRLFEAHKIDDLIVTDAQHRAPCRALKEAFDQVKFTHKRSA